MIVANATGCSSIYGGNLPTTPWTANRDGRGPAWSNSLFEDNAEFGLGMRLALDAQARQARALADRARTRPCGTRWPRPTRTPRPGIAEQRRLVAELHERIAEIDTTGGAAARRPRRSARPQERLDRGRRRLGLRHRLRRPRPRPRLGPRRQRARARHRGLLEHGRPGVEVDAARGGREVRGGRQADRQEGSRHARDGLRQRLRRPHRARRRQPADREGARRGRRVGRAVARDRLQPLHRARHRHGEGHAPAEARRRHGLLAAVALRPAPRRPRRAPAPSRLRPREAAADRVHGQRGALLDAAPLTARGSGAARSARAARRRRAPPRLRATRRDRARARRARRPTEEAET